MRTRSIVQREPLRSARAKDYESHTADASAAGRGDQAVPMPGRHGVPAHPGGDGEVGDAEISSEGSHVGPKPQQRAKARSDLCIERRRDRHHHTRTIARNAQAASIARKA